MDLSCPVSAERVNENVVRLIAFMVALIAIGCIVWSDYWPVLFLIFDFGVRAFSVGKYSLLKFIAAKTARFLNLTPKMTDLAPKKFAATMGFVFCLMITATFIFDFPVAALILTSVMTFFALLESLFAVCVGCHIYTLTQLFKKTKSY
ncbi:DUF4395 domain-containing protein [Pedobacter sp. BMA]|uniref:DUF4395 domain-containing protein n=1 Tax=Pedobacter sp. BMA TaxID=1663685 RepID=UPI00064AD9FF|nr:DUF4395 domain-containing protein [Pedobacter sp. BMA]KLT67515.1 hypothetical protein AB669_02135 [Pedobacter sp. BMA]